MADTYEALLDENRRLRAQLYEREHAIAQFRAVLPGVYIYDCVEARDVYVSPAFWNLLGYTPEQVCALGDNPTFAVLHPRDVAAALLFAERLGELRDGEVVETELQMRRADGSYRWMLSREVVFTRDAAGHPRQLLGVVSDISALRVLASQQRAILDTIPDLVWLTDAAGRGLAINEAYEQFHGQSAQSLIDRTIQEVLPDNLGRYFYEETLAIIRTGQPVRYERQLLRHDGQPHWFDIIKTAVRDGQGNIIGTMGIARDVTEHRQTEEARVQIERRLQETQRLESLGVLAGGIAHDFNNLLTGILGHTELAMLELPPESDAYASLRAAIGGAQRAAELTNQILAYAGKGRFAVQPVGLNTLIHELIELMRVSLNRHAALHLHLDATLPLIEADVAQMRQVVLNLMTNAAEAIEETGGTITLVTANEELSRDTLDHLMFGTELPIGHYARLDVADTGCGMDAVTLAHIFDPFFTTKFTGRGLGLAAVQGIVRGHRGALRVESSVGKGTTFSIWFPTSVATGESLSAAAPARPQRGTVLVVDDEPSVRDVMARLLERMGMNVQLATDGVMALAMIAAGLSDLRLVVLDLVMPQMRGDAVARVLHVLHPDLPIVLMSGYSADEINQHDGLNLAGFIQKPCTYEALQSAVVAALTQWPGRNSSTEAL